MERAQTEARLGWILGGARAEGRTLRGNLERPHSTSGRDAPGRNVRTGSDAAGQRQMVGLGWPERDLDDSG